MRTLFVSDNEALRLSGAGTIDDAAARLADLVETVVVTLGSRGAFSLTGDTRVDVPAFDPARPSTPPAPATCWSPRTSGATCAAPRPRIACAGP